MRQVWVSGGRGRVFPWLFCICAVDSVDLEDLLCAGEGVMIASVWPGWRSEAWQLEESQGVGWWVSVISARLRLILLWWLMRLCLGWEFFGAVFPKENVSRYSKPKRSYNERSLGMTVSKQLDFFTAGLLSACTTPVCVMNLQNGVRLLKLIWPWSCLPAAATTMQPYLIELEGQGTHFGK